MRRENLYAKVSRGAYIIGVALLLASMFFTMVPPIQVTAGSGDNFDVYYEILFDSGHFVSGWNNGFSLWVDGQEYHLSCSDDLTLEPPHATWGTVVSFLIERYEDGPGDLLQSPDPQYEEPIYVPACGSGSITTPTPTDPTPTPTDPTPTPTDPTPTPTDPTPTPTDPTQTPTDPTPTPTDPTPTPTDPIPTPTDPTPTPTDPTPTPTDPTPTPTDPTPTPTDPTPTETQAVIIAVTGAELGNLRIASIMSLFGFAFIGMGMVVSGLKIISSKK